MGHDGDDDSQDLQRKGGTYMYTRLLGADAEIEYSPELLDAIGRLEQRFPSPEYAVIFADADEAEEDEPDQLIVCRRYGGILTPMVYLGADELEEYEKTGFDWLDAIASDLARSEADIEAFVASEETGADEA
jgi:hypothetical protein